MGVSGPETIEATVLRLRAERLTQAAIGARLGLRQSLISEILRLARILTLLAHGYTQARIAAEVGVCQVQVSEILRKAGYRHVPFVPRRKRAKAA